MWVRRVTESERVNSTVRPSGEKVVANSLPVDTTPATNTCSAATACNDGTAETRAHADTASRRSRKYSDEVRMLAVVDILSRVRR
jgi:hypothetical protein